MSDKETRNMLYEFPAVCSITFTTSVNVNFHKEDLAALFTWSLPVIAACILGSIYGFLPVIWQVIKDYNKNYFPILQDKHNQLLSNQPNVVGWETTDQETKVWVRSTPVSLPSSLFGYPTTIILEQPSKEPYRGSGEEVIIQRNKHNFFQEVWYGFMDRMAKHV